MTPIRVLVADDQPILREAIVALLTADPGITVLGTAGTAQEAIAQCATLTPDVVVMDVKMPGGGGAKATEEIRRRHQRTRVVAFSAHQDQATVLEMRDAGAVDYVMKGSPPAEIIAAIYNARSSALAPPGSTRGVVPDASPPRLGGDSPPNRAF